MGTVRVLKEGGVKRGGFPTFGGYHESNEKQQNHKINILITTFDQNVPLSMSPSGEGEAEPTPIQRTIV